MSVATKRPAGRKAAASAAHKVQPTLSDAPDAALGARVKALREASGLSLRDLAVRSGVSAPMLSQVERGETSPTLTVAARIAAGLELRLSQLLRLDEGGAVTVVRAGAAPARRQRPARAPLRGADRRHARASAPSSRGTRSRPAARPARPTTRRCTSPAAARPRSSRRAPSCSSATASRYELGAGDCVTFDADLPHHFENPHERARPPSWRSSRRAQRRWQGETLTMPKTMFDKIWERTRGRRRGCSTSTCTSCTR